MISLLPTLVVWPIGLTFALGPPLLFQPLWMGSTAAAAWMVSPPLRVREIVSLPLALTAPRPWVPPEGRAEKEKGLGPAKQNFPSLPPASYRELVPGFSWPEVRTDMGSGHRNFCPNPTHCVFSCQGTCSLQLPGCRPHCSCHFLAPVGDGALGGRCVPLLL